jgi:hypothetical protein
MFMVRKTHKGIMGKANITIKNRPHIGPGIGFKEMNLVTGEEIAQAAKAEDIKLD